MIIRGILAAIITIIVGSILSAIIMPLFLSAEALNKSAKAHGQMWLVIGIIVGIFVAIKHKNKKRT